MNIALSRLHYPVTTLGPGRRVGIWFQGCSIRCPGCVSADTWPTDRGATTVESVVAAIAPWLRQADGLTISGGEPFDQLDALGSLLASIPFEPHHDVLVYTGHTYEQIRDCAALQLGRIDALMSDPYLAEEAQTLPLRGSDNQRLHLLTERGRGRFAKFQTPLTSRERTLDVMFDGDGTIWLSGIPRPGDMNRLRTLLSTQGHEIRTTTASNTAR